MSTLQKIKAVKDHLTTNENPTHVATKLCEAQTSLAEASRLILDYSPPRRDDSIMGIHNSILGHIVQAKASLAEIMGRKASLEEITGRKATE